jgi:hypothetical protein
MHVQYRRELSVNPAEIEQIIRANIDKRVRAVYADDTIETLFIHTVDDEGFVCDLASEMSQPPRCAYWVRFTDIRAVHPARWESTLEIPSFTVEFFEHISPQDWQQWLTQLANTGASVEPKSDRVFVIACSRAQQLAQVGWLLFHSHLKDMCRVISTSGEADTHASAYPKPQQSE